MEEVMTCINRAMLFGRLPDDFKTILAGRLERREFRAEEVIVKEGETGDSMFILASGEVAVVNEPEGLGIRTELARLGAGQVFGEMTLFTEERRSATCIALEPTVAYELKAYVFASLLKRAPMVAIELCRVLALRVAELNRKQGVQVLEPAMLRYDPEVYHLVPSEILEKFKLVPVSLKENTLLVASPEAANPQAGDVVRRLFPKFNVATALITEAEYQTFVTRQVGAHGAQGRSSQDTRLPEVKFLSSLEEGKELARPVHEAQLLLTRILGEAMGTGASDVHLDPGREQGSIRLRVDGRIRRLELPLPAARLRSLITRLKMLAGMDISDRRTAQEGRLPLLFGDRPFEARLTILPTIVGESVGIRLVDAQTAVRPLEALFEISEVGQVVQQLAQLPQGVLVVAGPHDSGRTSTLYSLLRAWNPAEASIATLEDPVAHDLPGVVQVPVQEGVGMDFPSALRTLLRQDFDVILVGDTQDAATAKMVLEAGLSGHKVLTAVHANNTVEALMRLKQLGVEPFTLAHAMSGVLCQRLVRRLCPACAQAPRRSDPIRALLEQAHISLPDDDSALKSPRGCGLCNRTGYRGRVALYEVLPITPAMRAVIRSQDASAERLLEVAHQGTFVPIQGYAATMLRRGLTSPQEVLRILRGGSEIE